MWATQDGGAALTAAGVVLMLCGALAALASFLFWATGTGLPPLQPPPRADGDEHVIADR